MYLVNKFPILVKANLKVKDMTSLFQLKNFLSDYPVHRTPCLVNIGDYKLFIRVLIESEIKQVTIPMRQIKAWRVTKTNSLPTAISIEAALSRKRFNISSFGQNSNGR